MWSKADICQISTTGASEQTARADGKSSIGVEASHEMAADDLPYINNYKDKIVNAANKYGMRPSVVAAIISRESRGGRGLDSGWGDNRNAFGLMQVDKNWHTPRGQWDSLEHIEQGIEILKGCFSDVERKFPQLRGSLKGALAAYNMGAERMDPNNVDAHTTGGDYANDVTARAQYYEDHLF